jgi:hypothetical protein
MGSEPEVTLPFEKSKKLADGSTVLTIRVKDLPMIVESLERLMFGEDQEEFSVQWVLRESLKRAEWDKSVEAMEQHPTWDSGMSGWDIAKGTQQKGAKHQS